LQGTLTAATHSASKHYQFYLQQPGSNLVGNPLVGNPPAREPTGASVRPPMMFIKQGEQGNAHQAHGGAGAGYGAAGRPPPQLASHQHARVAPSQLVRGWARAKVSIP
jgi:hypothetical protein